MPPRTRPKTSSASTTILSGAAISRLIRWYGKHHRDLPWRRTHDPYAIWVSEILLQQTQVQTVKPYFIRFLERFPTVGDLAAAPLDDVLKVWEGCGYYARARNLHRAARIVVSECGGRLPNRAAELQKLPGIGRSTAAAIASIAHDEPAAVLDGNVERVLARVLCEKRVLSESIVRRRLLKSADAIMQAAIGRKLSPGILNQAFMELGATVCLPKRTDCHRCPLRIECRARAKLADVTVLPRKAKARANPHYDIGAAIIYRNGRILITQRPPDGLLGGLWEFPGGKQQAGESLKECVEREIREELAIEIEVKELLARVKHAYSHFKITLHAFECRHRSGRIKKIGVADFRWVKPEDLSRFAFPKADRVILDMLSNSSTPT